MFPVVALVISLAIDFLRYTHIDIVHINYSEIVFDLILYFVAEEMSLERYVMVYYDIIKMTELWERRIGAPR